MTQQLVLVRGSSRYELLAVVEISSETLTVAGLSPLGNRLVALSWDGLRLTQELDASVPRQLPAKHILRHIQLVYWPQEAIREALPPGEELRLRPGSRELLRRGKVSLAVRYLGDPFKDPIELEDRTAGYTMLIKTLELSRE